MTQDTRQNILEKNFEAIHRQGFQGTRTDKVIEELGITKGAFYHYFKNKQDLGYAVVDEILAPRYIEQWKQLDEVLDQPIDGVIRLLEQFKRDYGPEEVVLGCPLNNLVQEMAPLDEGFQARLNRILEEMHGAVYRALQRANDLLQVATLIDEKSLAYFILAAVEGSFTLAKAHQSKDVFDQSIDQLIRYMRSLKR